MAEGGFKPKVGLTPKCTSEMPANVEILPEQGVGRWVVRDGFLEDAAAGEMPTGAGSEA